MADKEGLRQLIMRLFKDKPKERERMLRALDDERFSCDDWMEQEGYSQDQRLLALKFSGDVLRIEADRTKRKDVREWTPKDWEEHEIFLWDCTEIVRELLKGYFTREQVNEIAEAWEHDRYVHQMLVNGYGRIHHCRFCSTVAN